MKNEFCKFSIDQSNRIISMALSVVSHNYYWLDRQRQYDLAMNVYCHLCVHNDCEKSPDPAYVVIQNLVHNRAENMRLIRRKSKAQRILEMKADRSAEENLQLDELASSRTIKSVSYEGMVEDYGYTEELGYTEDVETQIIKSDIGRIYRILKNKPYALKIVELVRYGFEIKEVAHILNVCYHSIYYNLDGSMNTPLQPEFDVPAEELAAKFRASLATIPDQPPAETVAPTLTPVAVITVPTVQPLKVMMALPVKPGKVEHPKFDFMTDFPFLPNPYRLKRRSEARS
jgi:hypothetical protein